MNWEMIGAVCAVFCVFGGILIAAAKGIFATKAEHRELVKEFDSKLYDDRSLPIFVTQKEWDKSKVEREHRQDMNQKTVCNRMKEMKESVEAMCKVQNETHITISSLLGKVELCIEQTTGLKRNPKDKG